MARLKVKNWKKNMRKRLMKIEEENLCQGMWAG